MSGGNTVAGNDLACTVLHGLPLLHSLRLGALAVAQLSGARVECSASKTLHVCSRTAFWRAPLPPCPKRSLLYLDATPDILAAIAPCYASACPVVLEAAAASLPEPRAMAAAAAQAAAAADAAADVAVAGHWAAAVMAAGVSAGAGDREAYTQLMQQCPHLLHALLLDMAVAAAADYGAQLAELLSSDSDGEAEGAVSAAAVAATAEQLTRVLRALTTLTGRAAVSEGLLLPAVLVEVLQSVVALASQVRASVQLVGTVERWLLAVPVLPRGA